MVDRNDGESLNRSTLTLQCNLERNSSRSLSPARSAVE